MFDSSIPQRVRTGDQNSNALSSLISFGPPRAGDAQKAKTSDSVLAGFEAAPLLDMRGQSAFSDKVAAKPPEESPDAKKMLENGFGISGLLTTRDTSFRPETLREADDRFTAMTNGGGRASFDNSTPIEQPQQQQRVA